jgi:hypothetical protein
MMEIASAAPGVAIREWNIATMAVLCRSARVPFGRVVSTLSHLPNGTQPSSEDEIRVQRMSMRSKEADQMLGVLVRIAEAIESIKQELETLTATTAAMRKDQWDIRKAVGSDPAFEAS